MLLQTGHHTLKQALRGFLSTASNKVCWLLRDRHGKLNSLTRVLLRMLLALLVLLLLREEEVRLGGAIGLPKGGHGYRKRVFRAAPSLAAGSRRDVGSVLALARRRVKQLSPAALLLLGT